MNIGRIYCYRGTCVSRLCEYGTGGLLCVYSFACRCCFLCWNSVCRYGVQSSVRQLFDSVVLVFFLSLNSGLHCLRRDFLWPRRRRSAETDYSACRRLASGFVSVRLSVRAVGLLLMVLLQCMQTSRARLCSRLRQALRRQPRSL